MKRDIIAIVDDDALVRESVQRLVGSMNFRSELFSSINELMAFPSLVDVGCVISDVNFAGKDSSLPDRLAVLAGRTPVIFMTADASPSLTARLLAAGAEAVLSKPFSPHVMIELVVAAIERADGAGESMRIRAGRQGDKPRPARRPATAR